MMGGIRIKLRAPDGQSILEMDDQENLGELVTRIKNKTGLTIFTLKYGYPLRNLDMRSESLHTSLRDLRFHGETLVVAPVVPPPPASPDAKLFTPKGIEADETVLEWPDRGGYMALRVMPDDNSCMFTAFGGAMGIENPSRKLRVQVAEYIMQHPADYSKVVLGEDPARYTSRIQQLDVWGGAIELGIFSDIYNIEISSIDVKSLRVDRFGEKKDLRCILLYSGIHYDRIAFTMDLSHPVEVDVTKWSTDDEAVLDKARELAQKLKQVHYYTDTTDFVIRCEVCKWIGQGTRDAARHERETGHGQFGEMAIT